MNISSTILTMENILGDRKIYTVPVFQRSYSWGKEQIHDFWSDLMDLLIAEGKEDYHFIGSMIFTPEKENVIRILDGQQRLATVLLFLSALRDVLKQSTMGIDCKKAKIWIEEINRIIYIRDIPTLKEDPKLILNRDDNEFFKKVVVHGEIPDRCEYHSHKLIKEAYMFFKEEISKKVKKDKEKFIESILQAVMKRLSTIKIEVDSDENANRLFETLNDRGLELSVADLTKNYIFSIADKDLENIVQLWKEMVDHVGDYNISKFLRHFWLSSFGLVKKEELYKKLKDEIKKENVKDFMQKLSEEAEVYANLNNPTHEFWADTKIEEMIEELNILKVEQAYILLLALYKRFYKEKRTTFERLLRALINFVFRYNTVCGLDPKHLEREYSDLAIKVRNKKITETEIIKKFNELSPSKDLFISSFRGLEVKNKKVAKYILLKLNNYLLKKQGKGKEIAVDINAVNLEHIIPLRPNDEWKKFFREKDIDPEKLFYRIGNMTILLKEYNKSIANKFFDKKKEMYNQSHLPLNNSLKQYKKFGIDEVEKREHEMAEIAEGLWKIEKV